MKRFLFLLLQTILVVSIAFSLVSCEQATDPEKLLSELSEKTGLSGTVYSESVPEGEKGFTDEDFFSTYFGEDADFPGLAVFLEEKPDAVGECAVFVCRDAADLARAAELSERRLAFLRSLSFALDTRAAENAFFLRSGRIFVFCALSDAEGAREALRRLL